MSHGFGTNPETLVALAWAACQPGLREILIEARQQRKESEPILRSRLTSAIPPVFEQDLVYGQAYHCLFLYRLEQVEYTYVDWALRGYSSVYLKESDETRAASENAEASGCSTEETALLWEAIVGGDRLERTLKRHGLSRDWIGDQHRQAQLLRLHFTLALSRLLVRTGECPFLVREFLSLSTAYHKSFPSLCSSFSTV